MPTIREEEGVPPEDTQLGEFFDFNGAATEPQTDRPTSQHLNCSSELRDRLDLFVSPKAELRCPVIHKDKSWQGLDVTDATVSIEDSNVLHIFLRRLATITSESITDLSELEH